MNPFHTFVTGESGNTTMKTNMTRSSEKDKAESDDNLYHRILRFSAERRKHTNGAYKSDTLISITKSDKIHSICDCIDGGIINGIRRLFLFGLAVNVGPG